MVWVVSLVRVRGRSRTGGDGEGAVPYSSLDFCPGIGLASGIAGRLLKQNDAHKSACR